MKKIMVLMCALCITAATVNAAEEKLNQPSAPKRAECAVNHKNQREAAFERRLGLTEVQKLKAKQIREQGHAKLKPVMEQIKEKHQEAEVIKLSRISVQMQEEKLAVIDEELKVLEKQAQEIRKSNMKEFESILTRDQKKTLKEMKKEGRKKYRQGHPSGRPPMPPVEK